MRWDEIGAQPCSIARTLAVVGDRWSLLILRQAFAGARRFSELQAQLGLTPHRLSARLDKLVAEAILERRRYQEHPSRHEYRLTEKGLDLYPVLLALARFGDTWRAGEAGPPVVSEHRACGHDARAELVCGHCGQPVRAREIRPRPGPGLLARGGPRRGGGNRPPSGG